MVEKINKSVSSNLKKDFDDEEASSKGTKRIRMSDLVGDCPVDRDTEGLLREMLRPIQRNLSICEAHGISASCDSSSEA